jgi:hypothetical protein
MNTSNSCMMRVKRAYFFIASMLHVAEKRTAGGCRHNP